MTIVDHIQNKRVDLQQERLNHKKETISKEELVIYNKEQSTAAWEWGEDLERDLVEAEVQPG